MMVWTASLSAATDFRQLTTELWNDINAGDSAKFFSHFLPDARLTHIGENGIEVLQIAEFAPVLKKFKTKQYQETCDRIIVTDLETGLVHVDVYFTFYIDEKFAFAGVDHVIWMKTKDVYKIETHYSGALKPKFSTSNGTTSASGELDALMNQWHKDVADVKHDAYFGFMDESFIFLGTDPKERWTKDEFAAFCKPHFDKGETWTFTTNWRNWYFSEDGQTAWFEESLDTWMDECRGSGVLVRKNGEWKIAHYNLSVLIENEKVDKFIKLRSK
jgi:hypothetical protein